MQQSRKKTIIDRLQKAKIDPTILKTSNNITSPSRDELRLP
jgi:hypothetical protein